MRCLIVAAAVAALTTGCGGDDPKPETQPERTVSAPTTLSATQELDVARAHVDLAEYCLAAIRHVSGKGPRPSADLAARKDGGVDVLIGVARAKPDAKFQKVGPMREVLGETAKTLARGNCDPDGAARLATAANSLPSP